MGKMRQFRRELRSAVGKPLLYQINDGYGAVLSGLLERVIRGDRVHDAEIKESFDESPISTIAAWDFSAGPMVIPGAAKGQKATALVSCRGIALYDVEFQPMAFSTLLLSQTINTLAQDPEIGTIVVDIDSPGGAVTGTQEAADAIFAARKKKHIVALVNPLAASAAYWIASQCSEIIVVPSADVGSIGVFMAHADCSKFMEDMGVKTTYIFAGKYKVEGNSNEPLSEEGKAYYQKEVDTIYKSFLNAVARGRGVSVDDVEKKYGQGRTLMAPAAKRAGMIDRIETIDVALSRMGLLVSAPQQGRRRGEAADETPLVESADVENGDHRTGSDKINEPTKINVTVTADTAKAFQEAQRKIQSDIARAFGLATGGTVGGGDNETEETPAADDTNPPPTDAKAFMEGYTNQLFTARAEGNEVSVYVDDWSDRVVISTHVIENPSPLSHEVTVEDDIISVTVKNGFATYRKVGEDDKTGDWLCELVEGDFEPMPEEASDETPPANSDDPAPYVALPRHEWKMELTDPPEFVLVCRSVVHGYHFTEKFAVADLPNSVVTADDMKDLGLEANEADDGFNIDDTAQKAAEVRARRLALLAAR